MLLVCSLLILSHNASLSSITPDSVMYVTFCWLANTGVSMGSSL